MAIVIGEKERQRRAMREAAFSSKPVRAEPIPRLKEAIAGIKARKPKKAKQAKGAKR